MFRLTDGGAGDLRGALGQDDAHDDALVLDPLAHFRALQERHPERVGAAGAKPPQRAPQVRVPADLELVAPAAEDGVAGLDLEQRGGAAGAAEVARRHVADVVDEVGAAGAGREGQPQLAQRVRRWVVVLRGGPLDAVEEALDARGAVAELVALLGREVAAPVADLEVALQARDARQRPGEVVAHRDQLGEPGRHVVEGAIAIR